MSTNKQAPESPSDAEIAELRLGLGQIAAECFKAADLVKVKCCSDIDAILARFGALPAAPVAAETQRNSVPLVGPLLTLPEHVQECVVAYGDARAALAAAAPASVPADFPARILALLREAADRNGTENAGPMEDSNGDPLQDDADAALAWIAARSAASVPGEKR